MVARSFAIVGVVMGSYRTRSKAEEISTLLSAFDHCSDVNVNLRSVIGVTKRIPILEIDHRSGIT
jgi:hypothetical protein